ncbi:folate-binding protein [Natronospirillum operosum]|uniref:Folate-binding protein n=1 Tax=Natronospirillum operosum TaxID=2759953 RepID=A0A4Z0W842_9GAMM|nr:folate-binding protein YgfZ [Natronospirillum operosum]TGG91113.1 folate-binding protein [Natronospirillum operosum]
MSLTAMPLEQHGLLAIQGPDSRRFLQGQCTADVDSLSPGQWIYGGFCTPKGRLYANFLLACLADDHYWLIMPADMVQPTMERLGKYAAFFKTELSDQTLAWHGLGLVEAVAGDPGPGTVDHDDRQVQLTLDDRRRMLWLNPLQEDHYERALSRLEQQAQWQPSEFWALHDIRAGLVWVQPATIESFLPQTLHWDELGGVSFSKGCYTGQEVVARLHYKGASKKGLRHVQGQTTSAPGPLSRLHSPEGKALGELASAVTTADGWAGLAVLPFAHESSDLTINEQAAEAGAWVRAD